MLNIYPSQLSLKGPTTLEGTNLKNPMWATQTLFGTQLSAIRTSPSSLYWFF